MNNTSEERFRVLKDRALQYRRIAGTYMLESALIPADTNHDAFLRRFAASHGFTKPDVGEEEWMQAEVFREDAHRELTETLMGGREIGHSMWDIPPVEAAALAESFLAIFQDQARYFCSGMPSGLAQCLAPYGRPDFSDYIFGGGCIGIDRSFVAIFWVLDND